MDEAKQAWERWRDGGGWLPGESLMEVAFRAGFSAARAEGVVTLSESEFGTVQDALMLVLSPIEIVDHRYMHKIGLITDTMVIMPPLPPPLDPPRLSPTCPGAGKKPRADGRCSGCGELWKLRRDGTVRIHRS